MLHVWGATPGKWLLGLELRDGQGKKLSIAQGTRRVWEVLWVGCGFAIPFYGLYRQYKCYLACREGEALSYDGEPGYLYYSTVPAWGLRAFAAEAVAVALIPLTVWVNCQTVLPPHRGEAVTPAEFYENVNALADKLGYSLWLDEEGWALSQGTFTIYDAAGGREERINGQRYGDGPVYTVETDSGGFVTAVLCRREGHFPGDDRAYYPLPLNEARLAAGALAGGQVSGWRLLTGWLGEEPWKEDSGAWTGQGFRRDGLELTIELEQEGFLSTGDCLLPWDEYESGWFRCEIRLERER